MWGSIHVLSVMLHLVMPLAEGMSRDRSEPVSQHESSRQEREREHEGRERERDVRDMPLTGRCPLCVSACACLFVSRLLVALMSVTLMLSASCVSQCVRVRVPVTACICVNVLCVSVIDCLSVCLHNCLVCLSVCRSVGLFVLSVCQMSGTNHVYL